MRILLAHNSTYYPSHGGGDKSNRLLMEALAARGHTVRVVSRVERFGAADHERLLRELGQRAVPADTGEAGVVRLNLGGVDVRVLTTNPNIRAYFSQQIAEVDPDVIITSTDDPGQLLFDLAVKAPRARVVYLVRATIAVPFGPESSMRNPAKTESLRQADGVVCVSHYVAGYVRKWSGMDAIHLPISLLDSVPEYPWLGSFDNPYIAMVNPCAVKGIGIFVELSRRFPQQEFAAVPTWGTTSDDLAELSTQPNIRILQPFDNIDDLLRHTRVMLVPSVWAEARSRLLMESMSRGVPVIASDIGGLHEAHLGVDYLIPVNPILHYKATVDANMVPVAEVPPQDIAPWEAALRRLITDRAHYDQLSAESRRAGLAYAETLTAEPFENYLNELCRRTKVSPPKPPAPATGLSDEKKRLLALRLKQRSRSQPGSRWLAGIEEHRPGRALLVCFPYAGGGTLPYRGWRERLAEVATVCAVQLPGREVRLNETPLDSMDEVVNALVPELRPYADQQLIFFGHSMGAVIAYELARTITPRLLIASAARSPLYRLDHKPPPEPTDKDLIAELEKLGGMPLEILDNPDLMQVALPSLRADTGIYRKYRYVPGPPINSPIFAYRGWDDPNISSEQADRWREVTTGIFRRRDFEGGHFYFQAALEFLPTLSEDIVRIVKPRP